MLLLHRSDITSAVGIISDGTVDAMRRCVVAAGTGAIVTGNRIGCRAIQKAGIVGAGII